jgi:predicted alpha/beta-hydrolase family hydrolase
MQSTHHIEVREGVSITALQTIPDVSAMDVAVVYAPGAGSNLNDPFGAYLVAFLESHGIECWRFQFPYSEAGRKAPDSPPLLEATWRAVIDAVLQGPGLNPGATDDAKPRGSGRGEPTPMGSAPRLVIGGRSMGGRIASIVAAKGAPVDALALFAYPLIPPGRTSSDRADHFGDIHAPTLFCSGTRDAFATPEQLRAVAERIPGATLHFLEGADHGFATLKSSGRTRQDVWQEACEALLAFLQRLMSHP